MDVTNLAKIEHKTRCQILKCVLSKYARRSMVMFSYYGFATGSSYGLAVITALPLHGNKTCKRPLVDMQSNLHLHNIIYNQLMTGATVLNMVCI